MEDDSQIITPDNSPLPMTQGQFNQAYDEIMEDADMEFETELDGDRIQPNVHLLTRGMRYKINDGWAQYTTISSMKMNGMGKSSLLYWMGRFIDKKFSVDRNFFFRGNKEALEKKISEVGKGSIVLMDEMLRLLYKRRAMTKGVVDLNEWLGADQRKTRVGLAGAIPDFWDLDAYSRYKVDHYVECLGRGVGILFRPDRFPGVEPWHWKEMEGIQKRRTDVKHEDIVDKMDLLENHPCFRKIIYWTKMPKDDEKMYLDALAKAADTTDLDDMKSVYESLEEEMEYRHIADKKRAYQALVNLVGFINNRSKITMTETFKLAGIDLSYYTKVERELARKVEPPKSNVMERIVKEYGIKVSKRMRQNIEKPILPVI